MNEPTTLSPTPLPWKSVTVLPPLIGASAVAALMVSFSHGLSLRAGFGLFLGVLAVVEIGYLLVLIAVNRRDGLRRARRSRER